MKKLFLLVLALELAVCGCGNSTPTNVTNTSTTGSWEAQLIGGTQQASQLNFVVSFNVENSGPLDITGFSFFNNGACFTNTINQVTTSGSASFTTSSTDAVTGTLSLTANSVTPAGNSLVLNGNLTGTSNGTTTTTGTLSNGVVVGTWSLSGGQGDPSCDNQKGTFIMCQGNTTCTPTT